jgi:hypothetical protein
MIWLVHKVRVGISHFSYMCHCEYTLYKCMVKGRVNYMYIKCTHMAHWQSEEKQINCEIGIAKHKHMKLKHLT